MIRGLIETMSTQPITTNSRVKDRLGLTGTDFDDLLDRFILATTARIERMCGRHFIRATYTSELYDGSDISGTPRHILIVKNAPINTLTSVEYKGGLNTDPVWTAYTANDYDADLTAGLLYFKGNLPRGVQNIRVTYTGGFYSIADAQDPLVPLEVAEVCEEVVVRLFKRRESEGRSSETFDTSTVVWRADTFTKENIATLKNFRRGNYL